MFHTTIFLYLYDYTNHDPPFSLSEQPLTVFVKLSYEKGDFAKAQGRKTERREGGTCC